MWAPAVEITTEAAANRSAGLSQPALMRALIRDPGEKEGVQRMKK